jgi:hypothetical protein
MQSTNCKITPASFAITASIKTILIPDRKKAGFQSQIFKLEWRDLDFVREILTVRDPKEGKTKRLPMSQAVCDLLANLGTAAAQAARRGSQPMAARSIETSASSRSTRTTSSIASSFQGLGRPKFRTSAFTISGTRSLPGLR